MCEYHAHIHSLRMQPCVMYLLKGAAMNRHARSSLHPTLSTSVYVRMYMYTKARTHISICMKIRTQVYSDVNRGLGVTYTPANFRYKSHHIEYKYAYKSTYTPHRHEVTAHGRHTCTYTHCEAYLSIRIVLTHMHQVRACTRPVEVTHAAADLVLRR